MGQLVELNNNASRLEELGVEVIAVFREEAEGVEGLQKVKEKTKVEFTLGLDKGAGQTAKYSPDKMEFTSYVVDKSGLIKGIVKGDLRNRAKSDQLLEVVSSLGEPTDANQDDHAAVERAVLDYVEGIYDVKPELIERSVHPDLIKLGYWRPEDEDQFKPGSGMTFDQLHKLAATYNKEGRIAADATKKVEVFDVMDMIATAKLTADWGTDYFHLVKENGQWKILQVVWQSPPGK